MMFRQALLAIVTGAAALFLAACGGGGGGGAGQSLSAEEFRQQADAICKQYEDKLDELDSPSSLDDLGNFVDKAVPIIEEGNNKLSELDPPDDLSSDWDRAMELQDENLQVARDLQKAIHDNDTARVQELVTKLDATDAESTRLARNVGLENCGQQN
jgi:hypothetical protein